MKRILFTVLVCALLAGLTGGALAQDAIVLGEQTATELRADEQVRIKGKYRLELSSTEWFSEEIIHDNRFWGYFESAENVVPETLLYMYPVDTYTSMFISILYTNLSMENVNLLERVKCNVVYDERYAFTAVPMQKNPDQKQANGETRPSTVGVPVEPLIQVDLSFFVNIPLLVRDTDAPLVAYVSIGEDEYTINLRDIVELY